MVSPKLILLYTKTWKHILKDGSPSEDDLIKFSESLPSLKLALSCSVCHELLKGNELFSSTTYSECNHFACKECKDGNRQENFKCKSCEDWNHFSEDETLTLLLKGFRQFCRHFLKSPNCTSLLESKHCDETEFDGTNLLEILVEGSRQYKPDIKYRVQRRTLQPSELFETSSNVVKLQETDSVLIKTIKDSCSIKTEPVEKIQFFHDDNNEEKEDGNEYDNNDDIDMDHSEVDLPPSLHEDPLKDACYMDSEDVEAEELDEDDDSRIPEDLEEGFEEDEAIDGEDEELPNQEFKQATATLRLVSTSTPLSSYSSPQQSQSSISPGMQIQQTHHQILASPTVTSTHQIQFSPQRNYSIVLTRPHTSTTSTMSGQSPIGVRFPSSSSTIRLANVSINSSGQLQMVRQVVGSPATYGTRTITLPISGDLANKKIIVRPISTTSGGISAAQFQKWSDSNKVFQYASGGPIITSVSSGTINQKSQTNPLVTLTNSSTGVKTCSVTETRPQQHVTKLNLGNIVNPNFSGGTVRPTTLATSSGQILGTIGSIVRTNEIGHAAAPVKKIKVRFPTPPKSKPKVSQKMRRGCRCGNAATQPGKLTCCGQRCPCYVEAKSCVDCRCKGCKNPYLPGGKKILQGINAVIDTKTNTTIPMGVTSVASSVVCSQSTSGMISSNVQMTPSPTVNFVPVSVSSSGGMSSATAHQILNRIHQGVTTHQGMPGTTFSQIIPLSSFGGFTTIPISIFPQTHNTPVSQQSMTVMQQPHSSEAVQIHNVNIQHINAALLNNRNIKADNYENS